MQFAGLVQSTASLSVATTCYYKTCYCTRYSSATLYPLHTTINIATAAQIIDIHVSNFAELRLPNNSVTVTIIILPFL